MSANMSHAHTPTGTLRVLSAYLISSSPCYLAMSLSAFSTQATVLSGPKIGGKQGRGRGGGERIYVLCAGRSMFCQKDQNKWLAIIQGSVAALDKPPFPLVQCPHHLSQSPVGQDVASMNQTVQHLCRLFHQVILVFFQLIIRLQVQDRVQGLPVMRNLLVETSQIKLVLNIVFIHLKQTTNSPSSSGRSGRIPNTCRTYLTEELVPPKGTKPGNPRNLLRATHGFAEIKTTREKLVTVTSVNTIPERVRVL